MELNGPTTRIIAHRRPTTERFLGGGSLQTPTPPTQENELNEDDIFSTGILSPPPSSSSSSNHRFLPQKPPFPEPPGILAVLPQPHAHLYKKSNLSSSSSSSSSSSRLIPKRVLSFPKINHSHSAPVNVPVQMSPGGGGRRREFDEIEEDEFGEEMLPPHEIVARSYTPAVACSVLEGVGRTLKGRDLRQVRNAVWRCTGFLD